MGQTTSKSINVYRTYKSWIMIHSKYHIIPKRQHHYLQTNKNVFMYLYAPILDGPVNFYSIHTNDFLHKNTKWKEKKWKTFCRILPSELLMIQDEWVDEKQNNHILVKLKRTFWEICTWNWPTKIWRCPFLSNRVLCCEMIILFLEEMVYSSIVETMNFDVFFLS